MSDTTRRKFVKGVVSGLGLVAVGCDPRGGRFGADGLDRRSQGAPPADTGAVGWADTGVETPDCDTTKSAAEGPYYLEDAPARVDLRTASESGTTFTLTGTVRSTADCRLLADAEVEIWHVMQTGSYDMESDDMHYRTTLRVGFDGSFEVITLKPISYETETGKVMPMHLHVRITAVGHEELITQLRFVDDPDDDGGVDESLLLDPDVDADGSESAHYDFGLDPSTR